MILFDMLMRGPDSYWKKQYNAEAIRRRSAEADAKMYKDIADLQEHDLDEFTRKTVGQSVAVELLNKKIAELEQKIAAQASTIENRDREIAVLRDALQSERDARAALKTSNRLWEEQRKTVTGRTED